MITLLITSCPCPVLTPGSICILRFFFFVFFNHLKWSSIGWSLLAANNLVALPLVLIGFVCLDRALAQFPLWWCQVNGVHSSYFLPHLRRILFSSQLPSLLLLFLPLFFFLDAKYSSTRSRSKAPLKLGGFPLSFR